MAAIFTPQDLAELQTKCRAKRPTCVANDFPGNPAGKARCIIIKYGMVSHEIDHFDPQAGRERTKAELELIAEGLCQFVGPDGKQG